MEKKTKENLFLAATAGRILQGVDYAKRVGGGRPVRAATAAIVAVDLLDGILARRAGVEGPKRRALDSLVDSGIIAMGLEATRRNHPEVKGFVGALAVRQAFVAGGWALDLLNSKQVKKGDHFHKLTTLSIAGFCVAAHHYPGKVAKTAGAAAVAINAITAWDYLKGWTGNEPTHDTGYGVQEVRGFSDIRDVVSSLNNGGLPQLAQGNPTPELMPPVIESTAIEEPL